MDTKQIQKIKQELLNNVYYDNGHLYFNKDKFKLRPLGRSLQGNYRVIKYKSAIFKLSFLLWEIFYKEELDFKIWKIIPKDGNILNCDINNLEKLRREKLRRVYRETIKGKEFIGYIKNGKNKLDFFQNYKTGEQNGDI